MKRTKIARILGRRDGIALVSAVLILFLITALGVIALVTSESDVKIVRNLDQSQKMFFLAEQTVDRVLTHLHYNPEGVYKLLQIAQEVDDQYAGVEGSAITLPPFKIIDADNEGEEVHPLVLTLTGADTDSTTIDTNSRYKIEAAIDPKNWQAIADCYNATGQTELHGGTNCGYARPGSNPFLIAVRIQDKYGPTKAFAAEITPKGPFDFAYFAQDMAQDLRWHGSSSLTHPQPRCLDKYPYYGCNTTFHNRGNAWARCYSMSDDGYCTATESDPIESSNRIVGDSIIGDVYVGGEKDVFLVRGKPWIQGQVMWRRKYPFLTGEASNATHAGRYNQTYGGEMLTEAAQNPRMAGGVKSYAKQISFFSDDYSQSLWGATGQDHYLRWVRAVSDVEIGLSYESTIRSVRILFRNDLPYPDPMITPSADGTLDTTTVEEPQINMFDVRKYGLVRSAITPSINNGLVDAPDKPGMFAAWLMKRGGADYHLSANGIAFERAALYGGTARERQRKQADVFCGDPNETADTTCYANLSSDGAFNDSWAFRRGKDCSFNPTSGASGLPYAGYEADTTYYKVPSLGDVCGTQQYAGIIFSHLDTVVSGVLDGRLSLFVKGDAILDHEIEYEKDPLRFPVDVGPNSDMDMLTIFARGDVIIPNSFPNRSYSKETEVFADDWSDAYQGPSFIGPKRYDKDAGVIQWEPFNAESIFAPQGRFETVEALRLFDDDGSEDLQANIVTWGYECHTFLTSSDPNGVVAATNCDPEGSTQNETYEREVINFRVGFYARVRTAMEGSPAYNNEPALTGPPFTATLTQKNWYLPMANQSGPLRMVGALLERVSGRVSFDYHSHSDSGETGGTYINSRCRYGRSEYKMNHNDTAGEPDRFEFANSYPCNTMGHESFELTYDPRLKLVTPVGPFSQYGRGLTNMDRTDSLLWNPYGQAAYEIANWTEATMTADETLEDYLENLDY